jgi:hypothetical protein
MFFSKRQRENVVSKSDTSIATLEPSKPKTPIMDEISSALLKNDSVASDDEIRLVEYKIEEIQEATKNPFPAEIPSIEKLLEEENLALRKLKAKGRVQGRKIDLIKLLNLKNKNGDLRWMIADPRRELGQFNGAYYPKRGTIYSSYREIDIHPVSERNIFDFREVIHVAEGFPILPQRIRDMIKTLRDAGDCSMIAVLFQPKLWRKYKEDPALIVEYKDLPGEYYALAIWGGDRPEIEEFLF